MGIRIRVQGALLAERDSGFALQTATHYTGIGQEIREAPDTVVGQFSSQLLQEMPNGLGRYEEHTNVALYNLTNHLGSTVATALADGTGLSDVYDYFPYGIQQKLMTSGVDKVTPTFTGKEIDEGTELYYFGARYYDPELGLWISPDPARQFHNPYSYAGNGTNPINSVDPDGMELGPEAEKAYLDAKYCLEIPFGGSKALETDWEEMRNTPDRYFEIEWLPKGSRPASASTSTYVNMQIAEKEPYFYTAWAARHEADHHFPFQWEKSIYNAGLKVDQANWHDDAMDIIKQKGGLKPFLEWNARLPRGDKNGWDRIYGRDHIIQRQAGWPNGVD